MNQPLVSIIMGVYNGEKTIIDCINSILSQSYRNWEFIICNDCSTDGTLERIQSFLDPRIILINNDYNMKLAASLNRCIEKAKGKYIARMDADDISKKDRLLKQVLFMENHSEFDVVGSWAEVTNGFEITEIRKGKEIPDIETLLHTTPFIHPTIMMRAEVFQELHGYTVLKRTKRGQDWDLWFRFYAAGHIGYNLQEALLIYHESKEDYKKRTLSAAIGHTQTALNGYKLLNIPKQKYFLAFKPIISFFIPEKLKRTIRIFFN